MEPKEPIHNRSKDPGKDARGVFRRLRDSLATVLARLAAGGRADLATNDTLRAKLTRGRFLKALGAGVAWLALTSTPGSEPARHIARARSFRSRPDLSPPAVEVSTQQHHPARGYVFVAPKNKGPGQDGPLILDGRGEPVWFRPMHGDGQGLKAMDFKVQRYHGEPVLTYYEGVGATYGRGEYVIVDSSYREVRRVGAANGYKGDHHEFLITDRDTALMTIYNPVRADLSRVGGSRGGVVLDGIAQEVDLESAEVLFEWHSLDHVGLEESYRALPNDPGSPYDYFHINSIDVDHDSNLLVSARWTFTVYKIDRESGEIIWRLGGKYSDFEMGPGTWMRYQHDARRQPDGTITIFDNGNLPVMDPSLGLVLDMDETTATLVRSYAHPDRWRAATQGNAQVLPNGNVLIGWGSKSAFSEFDRYGELLFDAYFPPEVDSYRAFRFPWSGFPGDDPAVAVERGRGNEVTLYASWNGATEVASWQALAGPNPGRLEPVGASALRTGFESAIKVRTAQPYVGVEARDRSGRVLGTSRTVETRD